jgi:maltose alpha-D-glucosyltransferase / alpha-amylase
MTTQRRPSASSRPLNIGDELTWYKDAIIYEVRTRSFFDSNNDGIGDLRGLASKLDYLQDLGVTALWLLPFYPSPGRDDGYDISDYAGVHPDVGTLADFECLLDEAHRRGLRVITELVLNHTSDQHPWFLRARRAPPGSSERNFYVWADSPERYPDVRIIFKDFEVSNWSWDREANAYYWHRFYAHQPDLNFDNPEVHEALFGAVDFWLGKGVDGLRLDAVPYLYEEEGTNCENLPRTHAFLRKLRAHVDARFVNRMLLAEANQWPEDAAAYFGNGDECHMNFHFPLMPRMFMSIHQEDRFPIIDIFAQTPDVHPNCQWALFLRNHDELTLEMVTDEERDYMYRAYADDAAMRINLGIRRRLAPLVGNSRRKMELLNGLLFSLPGTPVLYYGDEIGMGDNVYLGDRNGVRTPMQWSMDRNAGFSRANPQRLILPIIMDSEYHYESLNVENQQQNPTSFLWWTKRLIALRKRFAAFGRGTIDFLSPSNSRVLAFVRRHGEETVLVVANLSRFAQYAELDLSQQKGLIPVELFGKTKFPPVGDGPYMVTLGPHGFYWFSLERSRSEHDHVAAPVAPPVVDVTSLEALLFGPERRLLEDRLLAFLEGRPWLGRLDRTLRSVHIAEVVRMPTAHPPVFFAFVKAEFSDGSPELYLVPLAWMVGERYTGPSAVAAAIRVLGESGEAAHGVFVDALEEPASSRTLLEVFAQQRGGPHGGEQLIASTLGDLALSDADLTAEPHTMGSGRDHTTLRYGERFVLKLLRRLDEGVSPELEVARVLAGRGPDIAPRLCGTLELRRAVGEPMTVAVLHRFVPNEGTAWQFTLQELGRYYDRVLARSPTEPCPPISTQSPLWLADQDPPPSVAKMIGSYRAAAARLGERVAEFHLALASNDGSPPLAPEPYTALDLRSKYQSLRNLSGKVLRLLRERVPADSPRATAEAESILAREGAVVKSFEPLLRVRMNALRMRTHGNLHLGHVLYTGRDFVLTDFNGFRSLTLSERRRKRSPVRDLAWMVRSFEFAAFKQVLDPASVRDSDVDAARPWALHWASWVAASFMRAYLTATAGARFIPVDREQLAVLFDAFVLERALYELWTELDEPSGAAAIPLFGITHLLSRSGPSHRSA